MICDMNKSVGSVPLLLKGGLVVDGEARTTAVADVLVGADGRIAAVGSGLEASGAEVIPCEGLVVTAGFVDSHVHIESSMVLPVQFGRAVLPHGTTAVIADPHEVVNVAGGEGLHSFLDEAAKAPVDIYTVVPSSVPATELDTNGAGKFLARDMEEFVGRADVVGLGEVMCFADVAAGRREIMDKLALFRGKAVDGHTSGMPLSMLDAYVAAGVQNDHECTCCEEMMERYNRGMNIYVREGSAARNGRELLGGIMRGGLDTGRFAFCTDDKHLATIAAEGHISHLVRMARAMGFGWGDVARMASCNPYRFYGLAGRGNIRKGYAADIVVTDDMCTSIRYVIKCGRVAARGGELVAGFCSGAEQRTDWPSTVHFRELTAGDFVVPATLGGIAMELVPGQLLTRAAEVSGSDAGALSLLAAVERHGRNGNMAVCLLKGYGIRGGAVATSVAHDSHNVVCAGDNGTDMAVACNRLRDIGGGYVVAAGGRVAGELPLPAYGLMATGDAGEVSHRIEQLERMAAGMGVGSGIDAFTTLSFVSLPVIPSLRLLDTGLYDVDHGRFIR